MPTPTTQEIEHPNLVLTKTGRRLTKDGKDSHSLNLADTVRIWRTPDAHSGRGPSSETRMKMKLEKGMPISLNDQVAHPNLMWPTPTSQTAGKGPMMETLVTKEGKPAQPNERAYNPKTGKHVQITLDRAIKLWPTPRASAAMAEKTENIQNRGTQRGKLEEKVAMMPTPTARDWRDAGPNVNYERAKKKGRLAGHSGGSLNPTWVEWLMGYPKGWTDLNH